MRCPVVAGRRIQSLQTENETGRYHTCMHARLQQHNTRACKCSVAHLAAVTALVRVVAAPEHPCELSVGNFLRVKTNEDRLCVVTNALVGWIRCFATCVADHCLRHTRDLGVLLVGTPKSADSKHYGALFIVRLENLNLRADWGVSHVDVFT